jgi:hypothetical protein
MSAGFPIDKPTLDARAGWLVQQLRDTLEQIVTVKSVLDGLDEAALEAMGYTADDVATLKSGFTDLSNLAAVAHGQQAQPQASDFFFFAKRLTGLN